MILRMVDIIQKKREGLELTADEINYFVTGYVEGKIPDYQASALLMAIYFRGMTENETVELTTAISTSGEIFDLSSIEGVKVDKHSTGGVGDKTTLIVAPIVASCGVPVAKMSGRGLGNTGGTIDKLNSIPGFRTSLSKEEFFSNIKKIGICISGQTANLAPGDKKLYALRDVTATAESIPLIASSIMGKKTASGADAIILDVKTGKGALMNTLTSSTKLADTMVSLGKRLGKKTYAFITEMNEPLGFAIGNSLEVIEAIETLKGNGPGDVKELSLALASKMLKAAGKGNDSECMAMASEALETGIALNKFREFLVAQGGNAKVIEDYSIFGKAAFNVSITADREGYISGIAADLTGHVSMTLGAGREKESDAPDYNAGIMLSKKVGMYVKNGETIATLYTNKKDVLPEAEIIFKQAISISDRKPEILPLILGSIE